MKDYLKKYKDSYQLLPQLPKMKKLWHAGYWDGPLSGVCEIDGQKCWYEAVAEWIDDNSYPSEDDPAYEEFEPPWYRRYLIHKLTDAQFKEIEAWHDKFRRMVGTHCDYDDQGIRSNFHYNETITPETFKQYYEESKTQKVIDVGPVSDDQILGWYEW